MKHYFKILFSSCLCLGSVGSGMAQIQPASAPDQTAPQATQALVRNAAGERVTVGDVQAELTRLPDANRAAVLANASSIEQLVTNLLARRLMAKEAVRDGLDKDAIVQSKLALASDRILSDERLAKIDQQAAPSDFALETHARSAYKAVASRFDTPAQTRASHILIENKGPESLAKANDLLNQLRGGASFEDLAKAHSADPGSAAKGGSLGFFGAGQMVKPFEDAANALQKPGDLSEPVESQFGYHIIRLDERREKGRKPFEEVRQALIDEARVSLRNEARTKKVESLSKDFVIDRPAIEALGKAEAK